MKRSAITGVIAAMATYSGLALSQQPPLAPAGPAPTPAAAAAQGQTTSPAPAGTNESPGASGVKTQAAGTSTAAGELPPVGASAAAPPATAEVSGETVAPDAPIAEPTPDAAEPSTEPALKLYGHGRLDAAFATGRMANAQFGLWALAPNANGDYEKEFTLYPRWSRFGADWNGGGLGGNLAKISAKIEIDFHDNVAANSGKSESRAMPRMRHAYGQVQMGDVTILAGQTWDLFSPLIAGGMEQAIFWYGGNLGDRRPQLRVTYAPTFGPATLVVAAAAAQSGAVDMQDLDGDGVMDGNAWASPAAQGLIELKLTAFGEKPLRVGVSGHYGGKTLQVAGADQNFKVLGLVGHAEIPISILTFRAEVWTGENMSDLRGGIGQGIRVVRNAADVTLIDSGEGLSASGGWLHVNLAPVSWYSVTLGVGRDELGSPNVGERARNDTLNFANVFSPWKPVKLSLVYDHYWTQYEGGPKASVHRFCASTMVSF